MINELKFSQKIVVENQKNNFSSSAIFNIKSG